MISFWLLEKKQLHDFTLFVQKYSCKITKKKLFKLVCLQFLSLPVLSQSLIKVEA